MRLRPDETLRQTLVVEAFRALTWLGRVLPTTTGRVLFRWAGVAAFRVAGAARARVAANQARVLGRDPSDPLVQASTREAFRRYGRYWFDAFHIVGWDDERIRAAFRFEGFEHLEAALQAGSGAICVLPHMGNWDAAGMAMAVNGHPVVSVAERLEPERLFQLFLEHRAALRMDILGLSADARVGRALASALRSNRVVALVADRDLSGKGIEVEMFGATRSLPTGPALLSLTTGAPIIVCDVFERPEGWVCVMHPPLALEPSDDRRSDAIALTRQMGAAFERAISASPPDWHLFQAGWAG